jgi:hypothetical protein
VEKDGETLRNKLKSHPIVVAGEEIVAVNGLDCIAEGPRQMCHHGFKGFHPHIPKHPT